MPTIVRLDSGPRLSRVVKHGDTVYLSGLTADDYSVDVADQTRSVLAKVDHYLNLAGTDKSHVLSVQIWLKDVLADFEAMNAAWSEWADPAALPARATGESKLSHENCLVEMIVIAAMRDGN